MGVMRGERNRGERGAGRLNWARHYEGNWEKYEQQYSENRTHRWNYREKKRCRKVFKNLNCWKVFTKNSSHPHPSKNLLVLVFSVTFAFCGHSLLLISIAAERTKSFPQLSTFQLHHQGPRSIQPVAHHKQTVDEKWNRKYHRYK